MEGRRRRSFTQEYKRQAVDLVASSGRSVPSVASELGLRDSVLRRWVEQLGVGHESTAALRRPGTQAALPSVDQAAEIARLQRHNERLRMGPLNTALGSRVALRTVLKDRVPTRWIAGSSPAMTPEWGRVDEG